MSLSTVPVSWPTNSRLLFHAEGNANIVYRLLPTFSSPPSTPPPSEIDFYSASTPPPSELCPPSASHPAKLSNKLLRLRKYLKPPGTGVLTGHRQFEEVIKPLFREAEVVQQTLVALPDGLVGNLNASLRGMEAEGQRKAVRKGTWLDEAEGHGLFVEDMTAEAYEGEAICLEFKPKWLAQSRTAPRGAKRCRTCALRLQRERSGEAERKRGGEGFCPLDLVAEGREGMRRAVDGLVARGEGDKRAWGEEAKERAVQFLWEGGLLRRLRDLQVRLDPGGVIQEGNVGQDLLTAMTLRDCTLFLRIPLAKDGKIEARLGDLDLKFPGKAGCWASQERQLIDEGWYMANEQHGTKHGITCAIARTGSPPRG